MRRPGQPAVRIQRGRLARVPCGLRHPLGHIRAEADDHALQGLVGDDVPCAQQLGREGRLRRGLVRLRRQRRGQDPLDLERAPGVALLVPADEVQRARGRGRLDRQRSDPPMLADLARFVDIRTVLDLHHAPLRPCLGEDAEHACEGLVAGRGGVGIDGRAQVLGEHRRQDLGQLHVRADELRVALVAGARQQPGGKEEGHRLIERERERRQEGFARQAPLPLVLPDGKLRVQGHRIEVAVDRAPGHADAPGDVHRRDALRVGLQLADDAQVASGPVPSGAAALGRGHRWCRCMASIMAPPPGRTKAVEPDRGTDLPPPPLPAARPGARRHGRTRAAPRGSRPAARTSATRRQGSR